MSKPNIDGVPAMPKCTAGQMEFGRLGRRVLSADFDGGALSSDGGLLLLRRIDEQIGLSRAVASVLHDARDPDRITYDCGEAGSMAPGTPRRLSRYLSLNSASLGRMSVSSYAAKVRFRFPPLAVQGAEQLARSHPIQLFPSQKKPADSGLLSDKELRGQSRF